MAIVMRKRKNKTKSILFSVCLICNQIYGIKDGQGVTGLSHGYCPECGKIILEQDRLENSEFYK